MTVPLRVLVWQWGRRGAGPRLAVALAEGLRAAPGIQVTLSLSRQAEILTGASPPRCDLPVDTYNGLGGFAVRFLTAPFALRRLTAQVSRLAPDIAICAMPGPLDFMMAAAVHRAGGRSIVILHDADAHPGDGFPGQMWLQRRLCHRADAVAYLSAHVGARLREQGIVGAPLIAIHHPPLHFGVPPAAPHDGPLRLLHFGRLLPYKGLDLLAEALSLLGPRTDLTVRIVGSGPDCSELDALRRLPGVAVENRWVPETEIADLLTWSDTLILPYREASQSGVAAAALAAGRRVIATRVGGLAEQLAHSDRATLCDPTASGVAAAIQTVLASPPLPPAATVDSVAAWRDMATNLLRQAGVMLPTP